MLDVLHVKTQAVADSHVGDLATGDQVVEMLLFDLQPGADLLARRECAPNRIRRFRGYVAECLKDVSPGENGFGTDRAAGDDVTCQPVIDV